MKRFILAPLAAFFGLLVAAVDPAAAQNTYPYRAPAYGPGYQTQLSPFLNMLRGGDPAANYFIGVVPEEQRRQNRNTFQGQIQGLTNQLPAPPRLREPDVDTKLAPTGHPTAFGWTGSYFGGGGSTPGNPFASRQGQAGRWPNNGSSPPGKPPTKPR